MNTATDEARRLVTEEIPVAGNELLARVRALIDEGRVRHIKVKSATGQTYFEVPLAVGLLGGAAFAWASPFLAMAGALAGMVTSVKLEVVRDADIGEEMKDGMKAVTDKGREIATTARTTAARPVKTASTSAKRVAAKAPTRAASTAKRIAGTAVKKTTAKSAKPAPKKKKTTGRR